MGHQTPIISTRTTAGRPIGPHLRPERGQRINFGMRHDSEGFIPGAGVIETLTRSAVGYTAPQLFPTNNAWAQFRERPVGPAFRFACKHQLARSLGEIGQRLHQTFNLRTIFLSLMGATA